MSAALRLTENTEERRDVMYEEKDYIMRIIHEIVRTLIKLVFGIDIDKREKEDVDQENLSLYRKLQAMVDDGLLDEAENLLADHMDPKNQKDFLLTLLFYDYLGKKDDQFLNEHDFSRKEVLDGLKYAVNLYGYGNILDAFMEDLDA